MEDDKLAAYYDELTRKGSGAARFKQGLGFSSDPSPAKDDTFPARGSALPTSSSFLSGFVRASSPSKTTEFEKQAQLQSIQNKLGKKPKEKTRSRSPVRNSKRQSRSRSPSRDRKNDRHSSRDRHSRRKRSRSRSRDRYSRRRSRSRDRYSRRRSRSRDRNSRRSRSRGDKCRSRSRSREKNRDSRRRKRSPEEEKQEKGKKRGEVRNGGGIDFAKSIEGYDNMTQAERVKAKMELQLSRAAGNDETIGKGSGWERFEFDKDAPLDDEEIEAAEDDTALVKRMGQSFRFSAVESRKEEEIKAAHDEAMFGSSSHPLPAVTDDESEKESSRKEDIENASTSLLSDQVLAMPRGSWRDRVRRA